MPCFLYGVARSQPVLYEIDRCMVRQCVTALCLACCGLLWPLRQSVCTSRIKE